MKLADSWADIADLETEVTSPPMGLPEILEEVSGFLSRYIVFSNEAQATAVTLWIAHTWVIDAFDYTPYLQISSPVKRCGKSRVFDCLRLLCAKPWAIVSPTEAVMFRKIEQEPPTLLLDEVDAVFTAKNGDDGKEALRALLNAGFERRATVARCFGQDHQLREFRVFCPKAFAGIGKLPDTVSDRSIPIIMARRKREQHIEKFRTRDTEPIAKPISVSLQTWSEELTTIQHLRAARPKLPEELGDRAADICEPLLAVADMAGGVWPEMARSALVELCSDGASDDGIAVQLLGAIREIFQEQGVDRISTKDLLDALIARDNGEPWGAWWAKDIASQSTRGPAGKVAILFEAV